MSKLWRWLSTIDSLKLVDALRHGNNGSVLVPYYNNYAKLLPATANILLEKYGGDPKNIWKNGNISEVRRRLEELPGIGPKLSRMAMLILLRDHGIFGKDALPGLDVAPDTHVICVFKRSGLIPRTGAKNRAVAAAITAARELHPTFPGELDPPAFIIGSNWCHPSNPNCEECPLVKDCPRKGLV
ncbi:MAG: endonuclease III domain-containing protein [Methylocystis sp.]|uniref:endonuclease III domain-containing protein n=1 Tax=Methylocystis sp. TaxID=1911079 RepID=UPI003DA21D0C